MLKWLALLAYALSTCGRPMIPNARGIWVHSEHSAAVSRVYAVSAVATFATYGRFGVPLWPGLPMQLEGLCQKAEDWRIGSQSPGADNERPPVAWLFQHYVRLHKRWWECLAVDW